MANRTFDDRLIGKQAASKLSASLSAKTSGFAEHFNRPANQKSLKETVAVPRFKKYGLLKNNTASHYLRAISIVMPKHGFIRHFGVDINRASGQRTRQNPRSFQYHYRSHPMKQAARPFLEEAIQSSGVIAFVTQKITESRGEEIAQNIAVSIRNFSN